MSARDLSPPPSSSIPGVDGASVTGVSVECPVCDHSNPAGANYCNDCGAPVHLVGCPQCDAINDRDCAFCYKCRAPMTGRMLPGGKRNLSRPPPPQNDAAMDGDHGPLIIAAGSTAQQPAIAQRVQTPRLTLPERAIVEGSDSGALAPPSSPVKPVALSAATDRSDTLQASDEQTVSEPSTLPLDVPIPGDRLMRLFDEAHLAVPGGASAVEPVIVTRRTGRWSLWRWTPLAGGLLLVLFATSAIALFAHYRPGAIDRGIATARLALRGAASPALDGGAPRGNNPGEQAVPTVSQTFPAMAVSPDPLKRDVSVPDAPAVSREASGSAAPAATDPGTRSIPAASGNPSVRPPTRAVVAKRTPARTPGARTPKAPVTSAHGRSRTSAGAAARKPISTSKSNPPSGRNGSTARPVPCTAALAASGLCAPAAQGTSR